MTLFPQPDPNRCDCPCHTDAHVQHIMPCCLPCSTCGRVVKSDAFGMHAEGCAARNENLGPNLLMTVADIIDGRDGEPMRLREMHEIVEHFLPKGVKDAAADVITRWITDGDLVERDGAYEVNVDIAVGLHDSGIAPLGDESERLDWANRARDRVTAQA